MEINEIINRIESIIKSENQKPSQKENEHQGEVTNGVKDVFILLLNFLLSIIKIPFDLITKYLKNEIINTVKKDAKLYGLIVGIMVIMLIFFSVLWLFISVAIGVYFFENGYSILSSILYSIVFQLISFTIIGLVAFTASTQIKSLKMLKKI